jgi:hypothetical protein
MDMFRFAPHAAFALVVTVSTALHAAGSQQADVQQAAAKLCNEKLDRNDFQYTTMEACVDEQAARLARAQKTASSAPQASAGTKASSPN